MLYAETLLVPSLAITLELIMLDITVPHDTMTVRQTEVGVYGRPSRTEKRVRYPQADKSDIYYNQQYCRHRMLPLQLAKKLCFLNSEYQELYYKSINKSIKTNNNERTERYE